MQIEQVEPNKPSFLTVVLLAAAAILVIFGIAAAIVTWRAHQRNHPPFTRHPVSKIERMPSLSATA